MSLWNTLKSALGLVPDPTVRELGPPTLSDAAAQVLTDLPEDRAVRLELTPIPQGWQVQMSEVGRDDGLHPAFRGFPIVADDDTVARLAGLELDAQDGLWRVRATVRVTARETPNPNGRLYLCDRVLSSGRVAFREDAPNAPWLVARLLDRDDIVSVLVRGPTVTVERTPDAPWPAIDRAVGIAIREHVLAAGGVLDPAQSAPARDDLEAAVWQILEHRVLPALHADGGDLELRGIEDGIVKVHLVGACRTCPASVLTLKGGIEKTLLDAFPGEIDAVEAVD